MAELGENARLTFNQFQRELQKRGIDPKVAYMLTLIYERLIQTDQTIDQMATLQTQFATMLQGFVNLREADVASINKIQKKIGARYDGVDVQSVAPDPEKH